MKIIILTFMVLYLYALSFGVFMTETFRIPAPLIFCIPLIIFFKEGKTPFLYTKELALLIASFFCYNVIGMSDIKTFAANSISVIVCIGFFNIFVNDNLKRYNSSIIIFYLLLTFSSIIMVLNHIYPEINSLRAVLMDEPIIQSPAGIATSQFTFGYQLAALGPFLLLYTILFRKPFLFQLFMFLSCLVFIYLGMQRSVFVTFILSVGLFLLIYYRMKSAIIIAFASVLSVLFYQVILKDNIDSRYNILAKNLDNDPEYNRSLLLEENLNIYAYYPLGLIFYGKGWSDVIYRNQVFATGITSHNAYFMFITYLGPFLGLGLLILIYSSIIKIGFNALKEIRKKENALLICLCFSFIGISLNALSHNAWLLSADGPTVFLYFSILHLQKFKSPDTINVVD